jgi:hypothetical protein
MKDEKVNSEAARPWYQEPWPWILAAGPAIVVVAGIFTAWLAVISNDGLVTDDYYRKGLAANQTIARSEQATRLGLVAGIRIAEDRLSVRLQTSDGNFPSCRQPSWRRYHHPDACRPRPVKACWFAMASTLFG